MATLVSNGLTLRLALFWLLISCTGQIFAATCKQPSVSFGAGKLTISSEGCTLHQVLTAVGRESGIKIEQPPSTVAVPLFANLGPGDPKQILSALLDGLPFNWALVRDETDSGKLVAVVLSEQTIRVEPPKPLVASKSAPKPASTNQEGKQSDATTKVASVADDSQYGQPKKRAEIDDDTLSKLPQLPPGVPTAMWQLYPQLVASGGVVNNNSNSGAVSPSDGKPSPPPLTPSDSSSNQAASSSNQAAQPKGCVTCPVPPGVDPRIVTLYPPNLMQLIGPPRNGAKQ